MPKRSRYSKVLIVNGNIELESCGKTYHLTDITQWQPFKSVSIYNPEEIQYCLTLIGTDYNMVVVCENETECDNIINELTNQGIGKCI
uniref:Uncharacterized protein n=1 Tax=viral metagenome TaxID=1070528 RepID=A0A6C0B399_9ZZZZ